MSILSFFSPQQNRCCTGYRGNNCRGSARCGSRCGCRSGVPAHARRRGVAFVYTALGLSTALILMAVVFDIGLLYQRKAQMQRAADAAALAGAYKLSKSGSPDDARVAARSIAMRLENGGYTAQGPVTTTTSPDGSSYVVTSRDARFEVNYPAKDENGVLQSQWYQVTISRPQAAIFGGMWPLGRDKYGVSASATAQFTILAEQPIKGIGTYGVAPGPVNLSVFGPAGRYSYGDAYSTQYLNDGTTSNPKYNPNGYNFAVKVPEDQDVTTLEIYDPDCYNAPDSSGKDVTDASAPDPTKNPPWVGTIDEYRTRTGTGSRGNGSHITTTQYSLYWDHNTLDNTADDVLVGTRSFGYDASTDMKWNDVFEFDRKRYVGGNFRLNVKSTAGSSENGFDLRVGPKRQETTTYENEQYVSGYDQQWVYLYSPFKGDYNGHYYDLPAGWSKVNNYDSPIYSTRQKEIKNPKPDFDPNNGTSIVAQGHLPINFNIGGKVKMTLGSVPAGAAGHEIFITKFDTDVGATSIKYTCDKLPGLSWTGILSKDGEFATDTIHVPDSYKNTAADGTWYAEYNAGNQDTSVWDMSYTGNLIGPPGQITLVK